MMRDLVACRQANSMQWLLDYFTTLCRNAHADPTDLRLVIHALLDSDQNAQKWPRKPYLDKLPVIIALTNRGHKISKAKRVNWLLQMIGMINYHKVCHAVMLEMA